MQPLTSLRDCETVVAILPTVKDEIASLRSQRQNVSSLRAIEDGVAILQPVNLWHI